MVSRPRSSRTVARRPRCNACTSDCHRTRTAASSDDFARTCSGARSLCSPVHSEPPARASGPGGPIACRIQRTAGWARGGLRPAAGESLHAAFGSRGSDAWSSSYPPLRACSPRLLQVHPRIDCSFFAKPPDARAPRRSCRCIHGSFHTAPCTAPIHESKAGRARRGRTRSRRLPSCDRLAQVRLRPSPGRVAEVVSTGAKLLGRLLRQEGCRRGR